VCISILPIIKQYLEKEKDSNLLFFLSLVISSVVNTILISQQDTTELQSFLQFFTSEFDKTISTNCNSIRTTVLFAVYSLINNNCSHENLAIIINRFGNSCLIILKDIMKKINIFTFDGILALNIVLFLSKYDSIFRDLVNGAKIGTLISSANSFLYSEILQNYFKKIPVNKASILHSMTNGIMVELSVALNAHAVMCKEYAFSVLNILTDFLHVDKENIAQIDNSNANFYSNSLVNLSDESVVFVKSKSSFMLLAMILLLADGLNLSDVAARKISIIASSNPSISV
jgi:hypothetical protein